MGSVSPERGFRAPLGLYATFAPLSWGFAALYSGAASHCRHIGLAHSRRNCFTRAGLLYKESSRYVVCHFCAGALAGFTLVSTR
jgi:hypothetical protein